MSGNKEFGETQNFPDQSPASNKPMTPFTRSNPALFTDLLDTIGNYTGHAGKYVVVNATETGLTVITSVGLSASDVNTLIATYMTGWPMTNEGTYVLFSQPIDMAQYEIRGFRLEQLAADPASPVNGQMWYNTTTHLPKVRMNGITASFYTAAEAQRLTDVESLATTADANATTALSSITSIVSDNVLSMAEKPSVKLEYDILIAERSGIDALATTYSITTEKTNYDNAVIALTAYITGLNPLYTDFTQDTVIVGTTFRSTFALVYSTRQILLNKISDTAKTLIATAQGVADAAVPTADAAAAAAHAARTKTTIDAGLITTGRIEVGDGALGANNAGMTGIVSGTPATDIRFWAGATYANRATAPWRVQNDGKFYSTAGQVGGWNLDTDAIYSGTKVAGDGFSASAGHTTIKSDGSIHSYNFYINADGSIAMRGLGSIGLNIDGSGFGLKMVGSSLWEDNADSDSGALSINNVGYNGGTTRFRNLFIRDGKGASIVDFIGSTKFATYNGSINPSAPIIYNPFVLSTGTDSHIHMTNASDPLIVGSYNTMTQYAYLPTTGLYSGMSFKFVNTSSQNLIIDHDGGAQIMTAGTPADTKTLAQYETCELIYIVGFAGNYWYSI